MIRSRRRLVRIIAAALVAGAAGISAPGAQAQVGEDEDRYTPLIPSVMSTPRWFEGTDDRAHLVYELQLVNGFPVPVTVTGVEVRDATDDRRIGVHSGGS